MWKSVFAVTAVLFTGAQAFAEDGNWYAAGQFGVRAIEREAATAPGVNIDVELDNGTYLSGAVGRYIKSDGVALRVEGEVAWRGGNINNFSINNVPAAVSGDGFSALSFMANTYVDFKNKSRFTPYLGVGAGVARINGDISAGANVLDDTATSFAFQAIGGVDIAVTKNASLYTDLRYFRAIGTKMTLMGSAGSGDIDVDYDAYTVGLGVRFRF